MKFLSILLASLWSGAASAAAMTFVHPGALDSREELDFVKAEIQAGAEPWSGEFERIRASRFASREPHPLAGIDSKTDDARVSRDDAIAAYTQALLWYYSGAQSYARGSIALLDSWAQLRGFTSGTEQDRLQAGWIGAVFAPAAEIMRGYSGWTPDRIGNLQAMFRRAFYPQLNSASPWNGNVDLTEIDAMLAIAVFNDDEAEFDRGLARLRVRSRAYFYLAADGARPPAIAGDRDNYRKFWYNPSKWVDGLTQETCRDNGHHAQFALGSALHAAETAWHQGFDVYGENQERYTAAMELMAAQFLTDSMHGVAADDTPTRDRYDTWEVGYSHYHNVAGIDLPNTRRLILGQIRPGARRADWNLVYETLTHADLPGRVQSRPGAAASIQR